MSSSAYIYDHLTPEEAAEHKQLAKLHRIQSLKLKPGPLTLAETAELCGISPEYVRQLQRSGEHKVKKEIITNHPDLIKDHTN